MTAAYQHIINSVIMIIISDDVLNMQLINDKFHFH
jgi:hypothetical protein